MPVWLKRELEIAFQKRDLFRIKCLNESFFYSLTLKDKGE